RRPVRLAAHPAERRATVPGARLSDPAGALRIALHGDHAELTDREARVHVAGPDHRLHGNSGVLLVAARRPARPRLASTIPGAMLSRPALEDATQRPKGAAKACWTSPVWPARMLSRPARRRGQAKFLNGRESMAPQPLTLSHALVR